MTGYKWAQLDFLLWKIRVLKLSLEITCESCSQTSLFGPQLHCCFSHLISWQRWAGNLLSLLWNILSRWLLFLNLTPHRPPDCAQDTSHCWLLHRFCTHVWRGWWRSAGSQQVTRGMMGNLSRTVPWAPICSAEGTCLEQVETEEWLGSWSSSPNISRDTEVVFPRLGCLMVLAPKTPTEWKI